MKATGIVRRIDDLGPGGNSQGDPPHYTHPRGRPITDNLFSVLYTFNHRIAKVKREAKVSTLQHLKLLHHAIDALFEISCPTEQ